jgi:Sec-independent protein secretion pathway component TatC
MARPRRASFEDRLTLVEHLDELRARIVVSISAFAVASALCFLQNSRLLDIANAPLPGDRTPITFGVAEPFTTTLTITLYAAIVISLPVILYQAYAYILPALTGRRRKLRTALRLSAVTGRLFEGEGAAEQGPLVVGLGDQFEPYRGALPCQPSRARSRKLLGRQPRVR